MEKKETLINGIQQKLGFVPNLFREMSESPAVLSAYLAATNELAQGTLNAKEQQVVYLTTSRVNECSYCQAAHTKMAAGAGVSVSDIQAAKGEAKFSSPRLEMIASTTRAIIEKRGNLSAEEKSAFLKAGLTKSELYEIATLLAIKSASNYIHHLSGVPIDAQFLPQKEAQKEEGCGSGSCGCN
jgi:uncharacterized peroxidase-related enzyme